MAASRCSTETSSSPRHVEHTVFERKLLLATGLELLQTSLSADAVARVPAATKSLPKTRTMPLLAQSARREDDGGTARGAHGPYAKEGSPRHAQPHPPQSLSTVHPEQRTDTSCPRPGSRWRCHEMFICRNWSQVQGLFGAAWT